MCLPDHPTPYQSVKATQANRVPCHTSQPNQKPEARSQKTEEAAKSSSQLDSFLHKLKAHGAGGG